MADIVSLKDKKNIIALNNFPREYALYIRRQTEKVESLISGWEESFEWSLDEEVLEHDLGLTLVFHHLLSILDILQGEAPELKEELKNYFKDNLLEEVLHDRNFNR